MDANLSATALALLRYRLETKDNRVTPQNKEAYRGLGLCIQCRDL
jgi:hypothetical protein